MRARESSIWRMYCRGSRFFVLIPLNVSHHNDFPVPVQSKNTTQTEITCSDHIARSLDLGGAECKIGRCWDLKSDCLRINDPSASLPPNSEKTNRAGKPLEVVT